LAHVALAPVGTAVFLAFRSCNPLGAATGAVRRQVPATGARHLSGVPGVLLREVQAGFSTKPKEPSGKPMGFSLRIPPACPSVFSVSDYEMRTDTW